MSWAAVAVVGGSIVSGAMGSSSAKKAGRAQAAATRQATALQREMYNTTRNDLAQYREVGGKYTNELDRAMPGLTKNFAMSDFEKDPGYDFRMQEGQKALERSAAARGGATGGAALKALSRYGQDYASNEYSNAYNRFGQDRDQRFNKLSSLANMGQSAAAGSAQAAQNFGNQAGQNIIGAGNAQAASQIASGNAWSNAVEQGMGAYAMGGGFGANKVTPDAAADYSSKPTNTGDAIRGNFGNYNFPIYKK